MLVQDLISALDRIAPLSYAEPWDKVGLMVGSPSRALTGPVLLCIDLTPKVMQEALAMRAGAIIAYHPPIWKPLDRLTDTTPKERTILEAAAAGIAIYSPHTSLDAAPGGLTDWLCEGLSGNTSAKDGEGTIHGDCRALTPRVGTEETQQIKIVTFIPGELGTPGANEVLERLRNAMATSGAGIIGNYRVCSFSTQGRGTFLGGAGSKPTVGAPGSLESVNEIRLEMVCSKSAAPLVIETLRAFHPYEEPAIDVYELLGRAERHVGAGRRLVLDQPATVAELGERLRNHLDRVRLRMALVDGDRPVTRIGIVAGAGADLAMTAVREGCELFVTGEMKHHEVVEMLNAGCSVLLAGHTNTERGYLRRLATRLQSILPGLQTHCSVADRDILVAVP